MKLSVSLPDEHIAFVDRYAAEHRVGSRSAVMQRALVLLRASELGEDYAAAWGEWDEAGGQSWDVVTADGLEREAR